MEIKLAVYKYLTTHPQLGTRQGTPISYGPCLLHVERTSIIRLSPVLLVHLLRHLTNYGVDSILSLYDLSLTLLSSPMNSFTVTSSLVIPFNSSSRLVNSLSGKLRSPTSSGFRSPYRLDPLCLTPRHSSRQTTP